MLDKNTIDLAVSGNYADFSDSIKRELGSKLNNNPDIKNFISEYDNIKNLKDSFYKISSTGETK